MMNTISSDPCPASEVTTPADNTIGWPSGPVPLHCRYERQCKPQPAYLEIVPETASHSAYASFTWNSEVGNAIPMNVYHGIVRRIPCSPRLTQAELLELARDIAEDVDIVINGLGCELSRDGNNIVGTLTDEADEAEDRLIERLDPQNAEDGGTCVGEAADWLGEFLDDALEQHGLTPDSTGVEIAAAAEAETASAADCGFEVTGIEWAFIKRLEEMEAELEAAAEDEEEGE